MSNSKYARDPLELHRENEELAHQLKEVVRMNTHWQRYDSQREEYVRKLTRTNQNLQDQISKLQQQHEELQNGTGLSKDPLGLRDGKTSSSESGSHWNAEDIIRALKDQITTLNIQIHKMENENEKREKQNEEHVNLLKEQVSICVDDFKQERRDRERCHEENVRLQKRLAQVEHELRSKKQQLQINQTQIKEQECYRYHQDYERTLDEPFRYHGYAGRQERPRPQYRTQPLPRRHTNSPRYHYRDYDFTDLPSDVEIDGGSLSEGYDEVDGPGNGPSNNPHDKITSYPRDEVDGPAACDQGPNNRLAKLDGTDKAQSCQSEVRSSDRRNKTTYGVKYTEEDKEQSATDKEQDPEEDQSNRSLICPKCQKRFGVMKHLELLDHINICVEND